MKLYRYLTFALAVGLLAACGAPPAANQTATPTSAMVETTLAPATPEPATALPVATGTAVKTSSAPICSAPASLTPALTEGPYYKSGSPERTSLADGLPGMQLVLSGYVLDQNCQPVPGAWLDFWQADSQGVYDNTGFTLRGHQFADESGHYQLETVVPGIYPGRTEHIHFKVQAPDGPVLTSQLFFPGVAQNQSDGIYNDALLIKVTSESSQEVQATFNFIIAVK
jgi:protocatechuate 3,4-dioxygenase beta subunit